MRFIGPSQTPQSAHGENEGEDRGDLERDEGPDPEELSARVGDLAANESHTDHVNHRNARSEDRSEQHDDVARAPPAQYECSVHPGNKHQHANDVFDPAGLKPADDIVAQVKRHEED